MSLLAEELVEEWMNRQGFFTIRGLKQGHDEIDLLGVKYQRNSKPIAWHVEVQASMEPAGFLGCLKFKDAKIEKWLDNKFKSNKKMEMRESVLSEAEWKFYLVYAVLNRKQEQLEVLQKCGVASISLKTVLRELSPKRKPSYTASGGDLVELLDFASASQLS